MISQERLTLKNDVRELSKLADFLEQLGLRWSLKPKVLMAINLSLEEAVSNIIFYAFEDTEEHFIEIQFQLVEKQLKIVLSDDGKPFDPLDREEPDTNLPLEERPIGGLGIHLIKKMMDTVLYERREQKNHFTLIKNLT